MSSSTEREIPVQADAPAPSESSAAALRSPLERFGLQGQTLQVANWLAVVVGIYLLITAVNVIGGGFKAATGGQAADLFAFASNPFVALMVGVVATEHLASTRVRWSEVRAFFDEVIDELRRRRPVSGADDPTGTSAEGTAP